MYRKVDLFSFNHNAIIRRTFLLCKPCLIIFACFGIKIRNFYGTVAPQKETVGIFFARINYCPSIQTSVCSLGFESKACEDPKNGSPDRRTG